MKRPVIWNCERLLCLLSAGYCLCHAGASKPLHKVIWRGGDMSALQVEFAFIGNERGVEIACEALVRRLYCE